MKRDALRETQAPLPGKIAALLRESKWFVLIAAAAYIALVLITFNKADPGWSHSAPASAEIRNAGGKVGAWLSDVLLYLFGVSAYWWVLLLAYAVVWGYRRLDGSAIIDRKSFLIALCGFGPGGCRPGRSGDSSRWQAPVVRLRP